MNKTRVTVWSEGIDPVLEPRAIALYPDDINTYIAGFLGKEEDFAVRTRSLHQPENGLSQSVLDETDVLVWWSHLYDGKVSEETAERVVNAVLNGMGLLLLHASLGSKPARLLLGKSSNTGKYREIGEMERVWVVDRSHPVVEGLEKEYIEIPGSEMYGEPYGMPVPEDIVFISWFEGGEVLRSGVSWHKGAGRIFYFAPGHEEFPVYYHPEIQKVIANAVRWLKPVKGPAVTFAGEIGSMEPIKNPVKG
ncbi:MAG TPA: ThuA domain-containing protein [Candidatus Eisenbergiella merdavium]|uniref:ThuA domain-containing protein n=1 Tax=Candidatus Eisenbergiella merdavium TaxID=2838551 RepID=A0A9D2NK90_9FIRM|nr:ThuA domain-containing protein [Candidatus Eisenbergiella merdavium]